MILEEGLYIDQRTRKIWVDGRERPDRLSRRELKLLKYLAFYRGKVCTREDILLAVERTKYSSVADSERFDAMIKRIRRKLGDTERPFRFLITDHSVGHHLEGIIRGLD